MVLADRLEEWFENRKQKQLAKERAAADALKHAHEKGRQKGRLEGIAKGRAEAIGEGIAIGRMEGQVASQAKWEAWNKRRARAERQGRTFDEAPPSIKSARPRIVDI